MKYKNFSPIPGHKKKLVALRMYYRGGYAGYFNKQVWSLLAGGYELQELLDASVNEEMQRWVENAARNVKTAP